MRALREKDYDDMAGRVVDRFLRGETKLAEATVDEAMGGQLNPDQIERLVQAANTMAFLRMMDARKAEGAPDMTHEFDPVDTRSVLQSIIGQTPMGGENAGPPQPGGEMPGMGGPPGGPPSGPPGMPPMPHAEPDSDELPDEMSARRAPPSFGEGEAMQAGGDDVPKGPPDGLPKGPPKGPPIDDSNDGPFPKGEKQKAHEEADDAKDNKDDKDNGPKKKKEPPKAPEKDEMKEAAIRQRRMRKLAALLEDQYLQAELAFEESYEHLSRQFKLAHSPMPFDEFEKDAMALDDVEHGSIVLNLLREERGLPPIDINTANEKHAALADRRVVSNTEAVRLFEHLTRIAHEAARVKRGAEHARTQCG